MRSKISPDRVRQLRGLKMFSRCTDAELAVVDSLVTEIEVDPGDVLIEEGRPGRESFIISTGEAAVTLGGRDVARLGPGEFFGEMAILAPQPRTATVTAVTPMHVLVADPSQLLRLLDIACCARVVLRSLVERLTAAMETTQPETVSA
jgi:CRP/FNR family cyclic AMP-dependent transcriptional regulator